MSDIERQRIAAVKMLQQLGFTWHQGAWSKMGEMTLLSEADSMLSLLVQRADQLDGCMEGSSEETNLNPSPRRRLRGDGFTGPPLRFCRA